MSIIDSFISVIAPFECLGCNRDGKLLCADCINLLPDIPERCYRCRRASAGFLTCRVCRRVSPLARVWVATDYESIAQQLIWRLKENGAQSAAKLIARSLQAEIDDRYLVVPIPTATKRARQRGFDQSKLIARHFAKLNGLVYKDCLRRSGQAQQVGSSRSIRLKQMQSAFRVKSNVKNHPVLLVDDVLTTGATLGSAAKALRRVGARPVHAIVFAQA